jgi:hypothetical protein
MASVAVDNGVGSVSKGDVQTALGWNNAAFDANSNNVVFSVKVTSVWRNAYGRGHGRPAYPPGLEPRHARLAADAAETCVRFIVSTMDDLELLPP